MHRINPRKLDIRITAGTMHPASTLWLFTQRPRGLMTSVASHLHPLSVGLLACLWDVLPVAGDAPTRSENNHAFSMSFQYDKASEAFICTSFKNLIFRPS